MPKLSVEDLEVAQKRVLLRVDFNVPFDQEGRITDETRIRAALPTIRLLLKRKAKIILLSHLGRPKGIRNPHLSLAPCKEALSEILGMPIQMASDCVGLLAEKPAAALQPGEILLLENLRFHKGEEDPQAEPGFVERLAKLGDLYVNDAFGTAHRKHASTFYLPKAFSQAAAGLLLQEEIRFLHDHLSDPKSPFVAIIGGAKVSTKLSLLKTLAEKADQLLVGGGMAYTLLKAEGIEIGNSLCEEPLLSESKLLLEEHPQLLLPLDIRCVPEIKPEAPVTTYPIEDGLPTDAIGVDIGPKTLAHWEPMILGAETIFWNGPVGIFEIPEFAEGTLRIAHLLAKNPGTTIVGGGDSVAAVHQAGVATEISHLSTGGGASLEYIQEGTLPGIEALSECSLNKS